MVLACSALEGGGIAEVWRTVEDHRAALGPDDGIAGRRAPQSRAWMWSEIGAGLMAAFRADTEVAALAETLEAEVARGATTPHAAARRLLTAFTGE